MINIQELQHKPISEIIRILGVRKKEEVYADLKKLAYALDVSVLSYNFETLPRSGEKLLCMFVTNQKGRSCIFYSADLADDKNFNICRIVIARAFARYILTGNNSFCITASTSFSEREKRFTYELLMPEEELYSVLYQLILPTTLSLANIFEVTQEFVRERLSDMQGRIPRMIGGYDF